MSFQNSQITSQMKIIAIDPGPEQSATLLWEENKILTCGIYPNKVVLASLPLVETEAIAIEMIASYGMSVGKEVFETCLWIGRFMERAPKEPQLIYRRDVKLHHCYNARATDSNIRQAILDRFGGKDAAIGLKAAPGPLYGVKSHIWSALAIALLVADQNQPKIEPTNFKEMKQAMTR